MIRPIVASIVAVGLINLVNEEFLAGQSMWARAAAASTMAGVLACAYLLVVRWANRK